MDANGLPVACSLGGSDLSVRLAEMRAVGEAALLDLERGPSVLTMRFRDDAETRGRLGEIIAAEAACCAFLEMELRAEGDAVLLRVVAPDGAEPVLDDLAGAFAGAGARA